MLSDLNGRIVTLHSCSAPLDIGTSARPTLNAICCIYPRKENFFSSHSAHAPVRVPHRFIQSTISAIGDNRKTDDVQPTDFVCLVAVCLNGRSRLVSIKAVRRTLLPFCTLRDRTTCRTNKSMMLRKRLDNDLFPTLTAAGDRLINILTSGR